MFIVFVWSGDWNAATASLSHSLPAVFDSQLSNLIRVFVSAPRDAQQEVDLLIQVSFNSSSTVVLVLLENDTFL